MDLSIYMEEKKYKVNCLKSFKTISFVKSFKDF